MLYCSRTWVQWQYCNELSVQSNLTNFFIVSILSTISVNNLCDSCENIGEQEDCCRNSAECVLIYVILPYFHSST